MAADDGAVGGASTGAPTEVETLGEERTMSLAASIAGALRAGDVVTLAGELGAGKTRFVKGLARGLGHDERAVHSPTYVVAHEYEGANARLPLVHVDAYRLRGELDADRLATDLGLDEAALDEVVVAIEWPEHGPGLGELATVRVSLTHAGEERRRVSVSWVGERRKLGEAIAAWREAAG